MEQSQIDSIVAEYTKNYMKDTVDHWYSKYFNKDELKDVNVYAFYQFLSNCENYMDFVTKGFFHSKGSKLRIFVYNMIQHSSNNYKIEQFGTYLKYKLSIFLDENVSKIGIYTPCREHIRNICIVCRCNYDMIGDNVMICAECVNECNTNVKQNICRPIIFEFDHDTICPIYCADDLRDMIISNSSRLVHRYYGVNVYNVLMFVTTRGFYMLPDDVVKYVLGFVYQ